MSKNASSSQKYSNCDPFWNEIIIENSKIKIKNKIDPNFIPLNEEYLKEVYSHFDNKKVQTISFLFPPEITFSNECINFGEYYLDIKNENPALASFISFLKIPYSSFYRNNQYEFNQTIIQHFINPENFKNTKANLKMSFLTEGNRIIYVYDVEELKNSSLEKISIKESIDNISKEDFKPSYYYDIESSNKSYLFFESNKGVNIEESSYSIIKIVEFNKLLNKSSVKSFWKNNVSGNYFQNVSLEKFQDLISFDLSKYEIDEIIGKIIILSSLRKYDQSLVKQAILQQVNSTGFKKISEFLDILSCFSKQFSIEKQLKICSSLISFLEVLKKNLLEEENQIKETFKL